jgi:hypothetical protein
MKFCPVVPEICRGQVHGPQKERRKRRRRRRRRRRIIIIRNGAKTKGVGVTIESHGKVEISFINV